MPVRFLGIGVNQYPNHSLAAARDGWDLDYAAHDCVALADELESCNLLADRHILADTHAGVRPWRGPIWRLIRNVGAGKDPILFYFAGHGTSIDGELRICPGDFDDEIADKTSIPISEIIHELHPRAPWLLFIVDCCRAPVVINSDDPAALELSGTNRIADNVIVMFACSHGQQSLEAPVIHDGFGGVFSYYLVRSFRTMFRKRRKGPVSVLNIFEQTRDVTSTFALEEAGRRQTPCMIGAQGADFYFST